MMEKVRLVSAATVRSLNAWNCKYITFTCLLLNLKVDGCCCFLHFKSGLCSLPKHTHFKHGKKICTVDPIVIPIQSIHSDAFWFRYWIIGCILDKWSYHSECGLVGSHGGFVQLVWIAESASFKFYSKLPSTSRLCSNFLPNFDQVHSFMALPEPLWVWCI